MKILILKNKLKLLWKYLKNNLENKIIIIAKFLMNLNVLLIKKNIQIVQI